MIEGAAPVLEVRDLEVVAALAETGGLAAAARRLHLTPSALSHRLAAVERRLGVAVVVRVHHRLRLTAAGVALAERAPAILAALAALEADAPDPPA